VVVEVKTSVATAASVTLIVLLFFSSQCVLAYCGLSWGPFPLGVRISTVAAGSSGIGSGLVIPDNFGQSVPQGAKTVSLTDYSNLQSAYYGGASGGGTTTSGDPVWMWTMAESGQTSKTGYGVIPVESPRGVAERWWFGGSSLQPNRQADLKAQGINSIDDLVKILQTDPVKSSDLCIKYKEGYYVTGTPTEIMGGPSIVKGFVPISNYWNEVVTAGIAVNAVEDGYSLADVTNMMTRGGYSKEQIQNTLKCIADGSVYGLASGENKEAGYYYTEGSSAIKYFEPAKVLTLRASASALCQDGLIMESTATGGSRDYRLTFAGQYVHDKMQPSQERALTMVSNLFRPEGATNFKSAILTEIFDGSFYADSPALKQKITDWHKAGEAWAAKMPGVSAEDQKGMANYYVVFQITGDLMVDAANWHKANGYDFGVGLGPMSKVWSEYGVSMLSCQPEISMTAWDYWLQGDPGAFTHFNPYGDFFPTVEERNKFNNAVRDTNAQSLLKYCETQANWKFGSVDARLLDYLDGVASIPKDRLQAVVTKYNEEFYAKWEDKVKPYLHIPPDQLPVEIRIIMQGPMAQGYSKTKATDPEPMTGAYAGWTWDAAKGTWVKTPFVANNDRRPPITMYDPNAKPATTPAPGAPATAPPVVVDPVVTSPTWNPTVTPPDTSLPSMFDYGITAYYADTVKVTRDVLQSPEMQKIQDTLEDYGYIAAEPLLKEAFMKGLPLDSILKLPSVRMALKKVSLYTLAFITQVEPQPINTLIERGRVLSRGLKNPRLALAIAGYGSQRQVGLSALTILGVTSLTWGTVKLDIDNAWWPTLLVPAVALLAIVLLSLLEKDSRTRRAPKTRSKRR
jgi:hypothetical protein